MRLGLIGFGNIATTLLEQLATTPGEPLAHLSVLCRSTAVEDIRGRLKRDFASAAKEISVVSDVDALLSTKPDIIVESAGHGAVTDYVPAMLRAGVDVIVVSVGALSDSRLDKALREAAVAGNARIILPAGALGGVDLLSALGYAGDLEVTYRGAKPPAAWAGTPAEDTIDLRSLDKATVFFSGTAREAAAAYPKNANVAATLAIAGAGFEATRVELIADPKAPGNVHEYSVTSPLAKYSMRIENLPSAGNGKTSVSTVYSVLREIRNRIGPVAI